MKFLEFLTLPSLISQNNNFKKMFISGQWGASNWSHNHEGIEVSHFVYEIDFQTIVEEIIKIIEPLLVV